MEFTIGVLLWSLLIALVAALIVDSLVITSAFHFNVHERLGKRTGKISLEGLDFKIPLIDKIKEISMSLEPIPMGVNFTTKDNVQLALTGSLQHNPDFNIKEEEGPNKGANRYISISEKVIKDGIEDMISDVLGGLGGKYNAVDFIKSRQALGDIINNLLQFEVPYHLRHHREAHDGSTCSVKNCKVCDAAPDCNTAEDCKYEGCGVVKFKRGEEVIPVCDYDERVDAEDLLDFYNSHWKYLKKNRDKEEKLKEKPSSVEKRYGIKVEVFALANVDFSDDMKKALEAQKQAEARAVAFGKKMEMAEQVIDLAKLKEVPVTMQEALNSADVSLTPTIANNKKVISVEGAIGVVGGLLGLTNK
ncbi:MAG: SPFH domain-containing protein [Candidatus Liptonbacteria bacterium]|nr:SPFH domain-containing protein [Candidatus Liptonbacteria bacterium]